MKRSFSLIGTELVDAVLSGAVGEEEIDRYIDRGEYVGYPVEYADLWHLLSHYVLDTDVRSEPGLEESYRMQIMGSLEKLVALEN